MKNKDFGLRRALSSKESSRRMSMPSNFAYNTMLKIEERQRERERRNRIWTIVSLASVSVCGIATGVWLCGDAIVESIKTIETPQSDISTIIVSSICIIFLGAVNALLGRTQIRR